MTGSCIHAAFEWLRRGLAIVRVSHETSTLGCPRSNATACASMEQHGKDSDHSALVTVGSISASLTVERRDGVNNGIGLDHALAAIDAGQAFGCNCFSALLRLRVAATTFGNCEGLLGHSTIARLTGLFLQRSPHKDLQAAAESGDLEALVCHLYLGASPNGIDTYSCAALHYVALNQFASLCRPLLQSRADVNLRHNGLNLRAGWTPLHFAAYSGARDIVLMLLLNRAAVNQMDGCRRTALYYAQNREWSHSRSCCRLLEKFGGLADTHLIEETNMSEALAAGTDGFTTFHIQPGGNAFGAQGEALLQWDATADAADMFTGGAAAIQFPEGSLSGQHSAQFH